jgi:signal transduction histidine kinase
VVTNNQRAIGVIHLKDIFKGGIKERFAQLRKIGIKTVMITGDNPLTAAAIAAEAGVDDFLAQATPEAKLKLIRDYQTGGRLVAMTGDGTNDAPALAQADVAVAMNTGTQPAREEADRLNQIVGNLLDMTRLEAGALKVKREASDVQDLIGAAIGPLDARLADRAVRVDVPADFPLVSLDFVLIVHVLHNLLDNALKYSPPGSPLEIEARQVNDEAHILLLDRGLGIPAADLERIFDKFYRVERPEQISGTGLGLAICKGIVEAHGGRIWAANREGGGTVITMALPISPI